MSQNLQRQSSASKKRPVRDISDSTSAQVCKKSKSDDTASTVVPRRRHRTLIDVQPESPRKGQTGSPVFGGNSPATSTGRFTMPERSKDPQPHDYVEPATSEEHEMTSEEEDNMVFNGGLNDRGAMHAQQAYSSGRQFAAPTEHGRALLAAAEAGNLTKVQSSLEKGADINTTDVKHGNTALHLAAEGEYYEIVKFLIEKGAAVDNYNKFSLMPINLCGAGTKVFKALQKASKPDLKPRGALQR